MTLQKRMSCWEYYFHRNTAYNVPTSKITIRGHHFPGISLLSLTYMDRYLKVMTIITIIPERFERVHCLQQQPLSHNLIKTGLCLQYVSPFCSKGMEMGLGVVAVVPLRRQYRYWSHKGEIRSVWEGKPALWNGSHVMYICHQKI